jgi:hypothetical protein
MTYKGQISGTTAGSAQLVEDTLDIGVLFVLKAQRHGHRCVKHESHVISVLPQSMIGVTAHPRWHFCADALIWR